MNDTGGGSKGGSSLADDGADQIKKHPWFKDVDWKSESGPDGEWWNQL